MENPIKSIVKFNKDAGLIEAGYDDFLESSFQIEEALEGFTKPCENLFDEHENQVIDSINSTGTKHISRDIVSWFQGFGNGHISDVERLDKACDAVVYAIGSMAKLKLSAQEITRALNVVMTANQAKLNCPKDQYGKLTKPANFDELYAPEPHLQKILDNRKDI